MRHYPLTSILILLFIFSCRKKTEVIPKVNPHPLILENIQASLKDSLSSGDYENINFSELILSKHDSLKFYFIRIPFKQPASDADFILLKTSLDGIIKKGRIIHLELPGSDQGRINYGNWNADISIADLKRNTILKSGITNGYIDTNHKGENLKAAPSSMEDPYVTLPEVIVVSSYSSGGSSMSTWFAISSLLQESSYNNYYSNYNYSGGGGGGGGYSSGSGSNTENTDPTTKTPLLTDEELIAVEFESQASKAAIDIAKYMKCFTDIPDAGATGSIEIFTDIPVNGRPDLFFDWEAGSPGHVFIQLKKQNGSKSACQNIGFYPKSTFKTIPSPVPVDGKFVDNQHHEYNASYKVNLTSAQINNAVTRILYLSRFVRYDIDDYNCSNWALDVFNQTVRVEQLEVPPMRIPGGETPYGSTTPQGLYTYLQQMQQSGKTAGGTISIPMVGWVGSSGGPCN